MTPEAYCAQLLSSFEGEQFLAVGEEVAKKLNPNYEVDRRKGAGARLPDLLSAKAATYRLREVKFKLEEALIRKALEQLKSGVRHLQDTIEGSVVDRLEIVIPLRERKMKPDEKMFLGKDLGSSRFRLRLKGEPVSVRIKGERYPITVLVL